MPILGGRRRGFVRNNGGRSLRLRDWRPYAQPAGVARAADGSDGCAEGLRRSGLRAPRRLAADTGDAVAAEVCGVRTSCAGEGDAGCCDAVCELGPDADSFRSGTAIRESGSSCHGASGVCRDSPGDEHGPRCTEPGLLRRACLPGCAVGRCGDLRDSRREAHAPTRRGSRRCRTPMLCFRSSTRFAGDRSKPDKIRRSKNRWRR